MDDKAAILKELGKNIGIVRKEKGMSQKMLAYSIGRDKQAIQRLEAGNTNPTYMFLHEIAVALGVGVEELIRKKI